MAAEAESLSFGDLLSGFRGDEKPWLLLPAAPQRDASCTVVSYGDLHQRAFAMVGGLRAHAAAGDRVIVVMDNSAESAVAVLAVLAAAMVAVPIAPPLLGQALASWVQSTTQICDDCGARLLLAAEPLLARATLPVALPLVSFEALTCSNDTHEPAPGPASLDALALLQYTSGTTARARGVALSQRQLLSNLSGLASALNATSDDVGLCWLPLFHDMGLIGSLLFSTRLRMTLVLMKPHAFLMRPETWLWAIDRFRVSLCAAPNAAYWICATKLRDAKLSGLNLASWRVAINGAELVDPHTLSSFTERFAQFGFRAESMCPAYGLAECATAATLSPIGEPVHVDRIDGEALAYAQQAVPAGSDTRSLHSVVSVGRAIPGHEVRIVASGAQGPAGERIVGAIQVRGGSVTGGYYRTTEGAADLFDAEGWLRTGDRGYLAGGLLYVLGRDKAVFKRAGRSIDCAYAENAVRFEQGIRAGRVAAFGAPSVEGTGEDFVLVAETDLEAAVERAALTTRIARAIYAALAMGPDTVVLARPGEIPHTTSGKVRRDLLRTAYLGGHIARAAGAA